MVASPEAGLAVGALADDIEFAGAAAGIVGIDDADAGGGRGGDVPDVPGAYVTEERVGLREAPGASPGL